MKNKNILRASCIQMSSTENMHDNVDTASQMIVEAAETGSELILTPENTSMMTWGRDTILEAARPEDAHPALPVFQDLSASYKIYLVVGSLSIRLSNDKIANRSYLIDPQGKIAARYDKIHLFDVDLEGGESYRESDSVQGGDKAVVAQLPWGGLGMTVCYDLRFPQLYRFLAQNGAAILSIPSAFTYTTGRAHWHTLLRARAIETGCFVLAPAQCGVHAGGRRTYGHSLILSPWGDILDEGREEMPGIISADLDLSLVQKTRSMIPSITTLTSFRLDDAQVEKV